MAQDGAGWRSRPARRAAGQGVADRGAAHGGDGGGMAVLAAGWWDGGVAGWRGGGVAGWRDGGTVAWPPRRRRRRGSSGSPHPPTRARGGLGCALARLLEHHPHHLDVVARVAPVALRVDVPHVQALLHALVDPRDGARHLARHERGAAAWRLVVEEDAVGGMHAVGLAVVDDDPVRVLLRHRVRRARVEGRRLLLRHLLHEPIELRRRRLVESRLVDEAGGANGVEEAQHADAVGVGRVLRHLERHLHVRLRAQVVELVRPHLRDDLEAVGRVGEVAVVEDELARVDVRVLVQALDPARVERRRPPDHAVHLVPFAQQQLREVRAVLAGDARDERDLARALALGAVGILRHGVRRGAANGERRRAVARRARLGRSDTGWCKCGCAGGGGSPTRILQSRVALHQR